MRYNRYRIIRVIRVNYVYMSSCLSCFGFPSSDPSSERGTTCCNRKKMEGFVALTIAVAMIVFSLSLAFGHFGGGKIYFIAAALMVGSIIPAIVAAKLLSPDDRSSIRLPLR